MADASSGSPNPSQRPSGARNRLADETSPYLLQHANNPVDWFPWGEEAFAKARAENKPVFLSVGYSTCHWCHVMAHESFENESTAALMNDAFVSIKVDREERPDIDSVYMTVTQAMTGQGGWPMTVFLTPDGEPFYAGTYFPPDDRYGRPGFPRLLESVRTAWNDDRERLVASAAELTGKLRTALASQSTPDATTADARATVDGAVARLRAQFDGEWGGFGGAPKFPSPPNLEFLLAHHARRAAEGAGDAAASPPSALEMVLGTLRGMAAGGMYDQLGGGFARYSVDPQWLVPHFEKMLYDNAQLARVYLHAYQITSDPLFARIARETLDYLVREMRDPDGGFWSAQDADSEGIEGKFFVWTPDEVAAVLGEDAALFNAAFAVTAEGNFEDPHHPEFGRRSVLSRPSVLAPDAFTALAREHGLDAAALDARIDAMRERMRLAREARIHPGLDDKVLTSWNGLALAAFAEAARVLDDDGYRAIAEQNAAFVRERMWRDGALLHTYKQGVARIDGLIEDYAYYALGLIDLYRLTGELAQLHWAGELFAVALARFRGDAGEGGGFFESPADGEPLVLRPKPLFDAATPSGNGAMGQLGFWLGRYFERREWEALVGETTALAGTALTQAASGFGSMLLALELSVAPRRELAIVGAPADRAPFEREVAQHFLPATVLAPADAGGGIPLLEERGVADGAAAYVCADMVCALPALTPHALAEQLAD